MRSLKEVLEDPTKYHYAVHYEKGALIPPSPSGGSLIVTYTDCTARRLVTTKNRWAEVGEKIYFCDLSDCVRDMYGDEFNRSSAFCLANLERGCCPRCFAYPKVVEDDYR